MVTMEMQRVIDSKVDEKFNIVENKLRNSFHAMKNDNELIKSRIKELAELIEKSSANRVLVEMDKLRANVLLDNNHVKESLKKSLDDFNQKDITPLRKEVKDLRSEVNRKNLKEDIKNQLRKDLLTEFEKKIDKRFEKFDHKTNDVRNDVVEYKKSTFKRAEDLYGSFEESSNSLKEALENTNENFVRKVRKDSSSLKRDFSSWRKYFDEKIDGKLSEKNERIEKLERQISYLKGRINSLGGKEVANKKGIESIFGKLMEGLSSEDVVVEKKLAKKPAKKVKVETKRDKARGFFSGIINSLADDVSKEQKKQERVVRIKNSKKLSQESDKSFMDKIVDSLSDD
jgi:hypothetical protein